MSTENRQVTVDVSIWMMLCISTTLLGLRLYCRIVRVKQLWWDDHLLSLGWVFVLLATALLTEMMREGFVQTTITEYQVAKLLLIADNFHKISLGLTKTSFALTLHRVTAGWIRYLIWSLIGTMNIWLLAHIILAWKPICGPTAGREPPRLPGSCWKAENGIIINIVGAIYSAVGDFVLALLPWTVLWGLQMKKREKVGVAVAMSIGILAGIVGVMKAVQSHKLLNFTNPDYFHVLEAFWLWVLAEPNATMVAASIPVLRTLVRDIHSHYASSDAYRGAIGRYPDSKQHKGYLRSNGQSGFHGRYIGSSLSRSGSHHMGSGSDGEITEGIRRTTEVAVYYDSGNRQPGKGAGEEERFELKDRWPVKPTYITKV